MKALPPTNVVISTAGSAFAAHKRCHLDRRQRFCRPQTLSSRPQAALLPPTNVVISTAGGAFAAAVERPLYFLGATIGLILCATQEPKVAPKDSLFPPRSASVNKRTALGLTKLPSPSQKNNSTNWLSFAYSVFAIAYTFTGSNIAELSR